MKHFQVEKIRNVAVLGHFGSGKTSLTESLLFISGSSEKKGEVEKKNTVSDYTVEEQTHQTSYSTSLIPVEWKDSKINFLDAPGSEELIGEINNILSIVKGAVIVLDASSGVEVGTERMWREIRRRKIPAVLFLNKMDKENIKFEDVLDEIRQKLGKKAVPFCWPIGREVDFSGFVNVVDMKARLYNGNECVDAEIWDEKRPKVDELHAMIEESVAETSDELMEKYFEGEAFTTEEIHKGLRKGICEGELTPIVVGSAVNNVGIHTLLDMILDYLPKPSQKEQYAGINPKTEEKVIRKISNEEPFSALVFKTMIDPFVGAINLFKVRSGSIKIGQEIYVANADKKEKVTQLFTMQGKTHVNVDEIFAGDIGAVAKMSSVQTGFTLTDSKEPVQYELIENPTPNIYVAIHPRKKQDEDKISTSLHKLSLEDNTFEIKRNKDTEQLLIGGQGMTHINYILEKLKNMFGVEVDIEDQKIVYRETIKRKTQAQGKYKKQSGGSGQYGDVHMRFEPCEDELLFDQEVFGGSVPRNYFPAVEKGFVEALEHGPLVGFPVIGVKGVLYDGSYHSVDSSELAFKMAAILSFKEACKTAEPTILEPIMHVEITVSDDHVGQVMKDISKRRGRVLGMEPIEGGYQKVTAEAPESEITKYTIDLKAMTQGGGQFTRKFSRYSEVPRELVESIIGDYKKAS